MKMRVKLYGTLSRRHPDYHHEQGMEVEIPDGSTVDDLLAVLDISEPQGAVVVMEGRILKASDRIRDGVPVSVFQAIHGG